jgi:hypothetical protein
MRYNIIIVLLILTGCKEIGAKYESHTTDLLKERLSGQKFCSDVVLVDLRFDKSSDDNFGTEIKCNGIATFTGGIERHCYFKVDIIDVMTGDAEKSIFVSYGGETQESMTRRFLQLLNSGTFFNLWSSVNAPIKCTFKSDYSGYYFSRDGDRYSFDYSISNIYHENSFPDIGESTYCKEIIKSLKLKEQSFGADFTMSNNRFVLNGKIKIDGPSMMVEISGDIEDNESSQSEYINWTLHEIKQ